MKKIRTIAVVVVCVLVVCSAAFASIKWLKAFNDFYKPKPGTALAAAKCKICHTKPVGNKDNLDAYGKLLKGKPICAASLKAIETLDADKDGFKNIAEIKAGTLPGDPASKPPPPVKPPKKKRK